MLMTAAGKYQRLRAPQLDGAIVCDPPQHQLPGLIQSNHKRLLAETPKIWGQPLAELAAKARDEILTAARQYTSSYTNMAEHPDKDCPLVFLGHQPELIHPGVWLKNFAAASLAKANGGIAINLIIDSDLCRKSAIQVPTGTAAKPYLDTIAYDKHDRELPFEESEILRSDLWESFGHRTTKSLRPFVAHPIVSSWWAKSAIQSRSTNNLGLALAQARHLLEIEWGVKNWELPQSAVCQTESFRRFAINMLTEAEQLRDAYNDSLDEYRATHRLRNLAQPMPNLIKTEDWIETPFWIWTQSRPRRSALFVLRKKKTLLLSNREDWQGELPQNPDSALDQLATWETEGVKLRTRALATTFYTRLLLADLFIHGIGGSKYDQVTDTICERFWGIHLPPYATLSGTLRLPIEHPSIAPHQSRELRQKLRALKYHPEKFSHHPKLKNTDPRQFTEWISKKDRWVKTAKTHANAAQRHQAITTANLAMQPWVAKLQSSWELELIRCLEQSRINQLLESREYPFCLFPPKQLHDFLLDF